MCQSGRTHFSVMPNDFFKSGFLPLAQQIGRMANTHSGFRMRFNRGRVNWTGDLRPSALSETYTVQISYVLRKRPAVRVLRPQLTIRESARRIPHTFSDGTVCLHLNCDWSPRAFIAETIVPWLSLWLLHYEVWHATGEWKGGGHEPRLRK